MKLDYPMKDNGMYLFKKSDFDDIASMILEEYMPEVFTYPKAVDIEYLATECFYLDMKYENIDPEGKILGMIAFSDTEFPAIGYENVIELTEGMILIDYSLCGRESMGRRRFTEAHEMSHWICHRTYHSPGNQKYEFRRNSYVACRTENIESYKKNGFSQRTDNEWEEWQADSLAAAILMPKRMFAEAVESACREYGVRRCLIKGRDDREARNIIFDMAKLFGVSYRAAQIRMIHLGYIKF